MTDTPISDEELAQYRNDLSHDNQAWYWDAVNVGGLIARLDAAEAENERLRGFIEGAIQLCDRKPNAAFLAIEALRAALAQPHD